MHEFISLDGVIDAPTWTTAQGHVEVVRSLLDAGTDPGIRDS